MNDRGQTVLEYVLVTVLIVMAIIVAFRSADVKEAVSVAAGGVQNSVVVEE